jgi:hypothetical protein
MKYKSGLYFAMIHAVSQASRRPYSYTLFTSIHDVFY